jgi:hypothetical protein
MTKLSGDKNKSRKALFFPEESLSILETLL